MIIFKSILTILQIGRHYTTSLGSNENCNPPLNLTKLTKLSLPKSLIEIVKSATYGYEILDKL